jgi:hypothetical protein
MTIRTCTVGVAALLGCSLSALAQTALSRSGALDSQVRPRSDTSVITSRARPNAAVLLLRKRVENVDWDGTPFEVVIDWLKDESEGRVNVVPRWGQLSIESLDRDTLVTLQLNNTMVADVLNEMVDQLSPDGEVTFRAVGNTLKISTKTDFDRKMYVRVYDATDILFRVSDFGQESPRIDLQQTGGSGGGGGGGGQSVFQGAGGAGQSKGGEQAEQDMTERLEELRTMIEQIIAPDSWDTSDTGGAGRIRIFNRSLIVFNTIEVHEMIAGPFSFGG